MFKIGIDIGGTAIKLALIDENYRIIEKRTTPFVRDLSFDVTLSRIAAQVGELCKNSSVSISESSCTGIALAGVLDDKRSVLVRAVNLGWSNAAVKDEAEKYFKPPVFLENDANAAAIAELHLGALRGCKNAILLTLGTGVGSGVIIDRRIYRGESGSSAELGHSQIFPNGALCVCGKRGCMETLCSASFLISEGKNSLSDYPTSYISDLTDGCKDNVTVETIVAAAQYGDSVAMAIIEKYVDSLSNAVAYCAKYNPEAVALGGGVSQSGDFLFSLLSKHRAVCSLGYDVVPAMLKNDAGILGSVIINEYLR